MSEQADIETALARATAAYKNVSAERDALKHANDRAEAAETERDKLRSALQKAEAELKALTGKTKFLPEGDAREEDSQ